MSSNHIFSRALQLGKQGFGVPPTSAGTPPEPSIRPLFTRQRTETLVFVSLDSENGGLPGSVRKLGPAFQGIKRLTANQNLNVIFQLPGIDGWMRATAKVVWVSSSGKAGGLNLVDIPGESRRLVDNWLALRAQAGLPGAAPGSQAPPTGTAAVPVFDVDSFQIVLPVEAIEIIPGPQPHSQPPAPVAVQASMRSSAPKIEASMAGSVPASPAMPSPPPALVPASSPAPIGVLALEQGVKIDRSAARTFGLALAGMVAMFAIAGGVIWQLRSSFSPRPLSAQPELAGVPSESAVTSLPSIATGQDSIPVEESKSAPAPAFTLAPAPAATARNSDTLDRAAKPATPERPPAAATRNLPAIAASRPAPSIPASTPQVARPARPSGAPSSVASARPAAAVPASTPAEAPAPKTSIAVSERPLEAAAAPAAPEKAPVQAAPVVAPSSPENPTGAVEAILDPYPSIRMPAEAKSKPSAPAALTIGRLAAKVDPVYPPDVLQQRISGTVKLHVVVGTDGRVVNTTVTDGPVQLRNAAQRAVEQWRYEPTLLGSAPVEAEEDVTLVFRITPARAAN